jgi:hypothetical protein
VKCFNKELFEKLDIGVEGMCDDCEYGYCKSGGTTKNQLRILRNPDKPHWTTLVYWGYVERSIGNKVTDA